MTNGSALATCFAHFLLAIVTGWSLKHIASTDSAPFVLLMLMLLLAYCLLGILRFTHPQPHPILRKMYDRCALLVKVCSLPFLNIQLFPQQQPSGFHVSVLTNHHYLTTAFLGSALIAFLVGCVFSELSKRHLADYVATGMLLFNAVALAIISTLTTNYWGIGIVLSSVTKHFTLQRLADHFSVPFIDLYTYGLIFYEIFTVNAVIHSHHYPTYSMTQ
ncbi:uncharacterized protein LOC128268582 [Anopheles cruzii]|uniref:uncharacterized protein LOC128268582 n=1 Tax=Anopheles cruzii TaxID=68878 RepID=UPI0022EC7282|nr:uncharacterized protein LOC128268582 [Anopheles cruzii]XP_052861680.1 uncharacterized protein LOC128268582 [Anopheles cruzii]